MCSATTSDPTFSPWAVKLIGKLSDEAHSRDGKRIWHGPGAQRGRFRRRVLPVLVVLVVFSLVFANRLAVAELLSPEAALVLVVAKSVASTAITAFLNAAGGCVPVAFLVWAVNSKLDGVIESLRHDAKRQVDTETGADQTSLIWQRRLLNDVTVDLAANADAPNTPYKHSEPRNARASTWHAVCCSPTALPMPAGSFS